MSLIQVDVEKCKRDGICAAVCPVKVIKLEGKAFPEETADAELLCMSCGHCVAVCPAEALSHSRVTGCLPFYKDQSVSADALVQFLKMRRSIREFKSAPVPRESLVHVIDTARWAPSDCNHQPVRWLVVEKPEDIRRLAGLVAEIFRPAQVSPLKELVAAWDQGMDVFLNSAPHVIISHASRDNPFASADCAIALTYLELAAQAEGLGTCWAGFFVYAARSDKRIPDYLGLPPDHEIFGAAMIGYPKFHYHRIPEKNPAVIHWL